MCREVFKNTFTHVVMPWEKYAPHRRRISERQQLLPKSALDSALCRATSSKSGTCITCYLIARPGIDESGPLSVDQIVALEQSFQPIVTFAG